MYDKKSMTSKVPMAQPSSTQKAANGGNSLPLPSGPIDAGAGIAGSVKPHDFNTGAGGTVSASPGPKKKGVDFLGGAGSEGPANPNAQ